MSDERARVARVRRGKGEEICGSGFAIDRFHILTCAHVADLAGAPAPGDRVWVDAPHLGGGCSGEVLREGWRAPASGSMAGDTALVRLDAPLEGLGPAPVRALRSLNRHAFTCYGFPRDYADGVTTTGWLREHLGKELVKLVVGRDLRLQEGFSGAPVWSDRLAPSSPWS